MVPRPTTFWAAEQLERGLGARFPGGYPGGTAAGAARLSWRGGMAGVCTAQVGNPAGEDQGPGGGGRSGGVGVGTAGAYTPAREDQRPGGSGKSGGAGVGTARADNPAGEDQGPRGNGSRFRGTGRFGR